LSVVPAVMSGRVVSYVGNQAVVEISSANVPDFGCVVSAGGRKIGRVFDVIGNVEKPYVVVKLSDLNRMSAGCQVSWGRKNG